MCSDVRTIRDRWYMVFLVMTVCAVSCMTHLLKECTRTGSIRPPTRDSSSVAWENDFQNTTRSSAQKRIKRQLDHPIPFAQSSGLIDSPESRTIAAGVCKAHCLKECADNLQRKSLTDTTIGEVLKALSQLPTQLRTECSRLSVGFLHYDECEQACESDRPYTDCSRMCETGDSPSGWSCLTGCRILDAALKQRSGECPSTGGSVIHRSPNLVGDSVDDETGTSRSAGDSATGESLTDSRGRAPPPWFSHSALDPDGSQLGMCTVDAECPKKRDKCCQGQCKTAVFREDMLPPIPTVHILEAKSPPSFLLSWERGLRMLNNLSEPIVYVLQVKTYFGPEFDNRLSSAWKTLVMSTLTGAQLSEPAMGWWYQFQVAAVNRWGSRGFELPTPPVQLTSHKPRPSSPPRDLNDGILRLHANGEIRVEIHWSPPAVASIPVTEYRIYWGPDSTHSPQELQFSEKPTQFVQTVPAAQTSYVLTGLGPDTLYRIQVLAMSAWGTVQLRSEPSQLFIKTPPISHLHQPDESGFPYRGNPKKLPAYDNRDNKVDGSNAGSQSRRTNGFQDTAFPDHFMACVCEGTSKSEVIPAVLSNDPDDRNSSPPRLQLHTDPAVYDGSDLRVRLHLMKPISAEGSTSTAEQRSPQFIVRWTPQVCIETLTSLKPHGTALKPADESSSSSANRPTTGSQYVTLMQMAVDQYGTQSGLITLNQLRRGGPNQTAVHFGELQLTRLQLNCRYLIQVLNVDASTTTTTHVDASRGESRVQLTACLCTPTCTKVNLAPWVPPLSCSSHEKQTLPEPQQLAHHLVRTTPLSYNITWLPGVSPTSSPVRTRTNRSKQAATLADSELMNNESRSSNADSDQTKTDRVIYYRVVWGPSRDKPIGSALWNMWPGLRPRLDPDLAETKVLRNGENSIVLSSLAPETQYVIKVQAIAGFDPVPPEDSISANNLNDQDVSRMRIRSSNSDKEQLLTSKEVFLYFKTPRITQSYEVGRGKIDGDSAGYRKLQSAALSVQQKPCLSWCSLILICFLWQYECFVNS